MKLKRLTFYGLKLKHNATTLNMPTYNYLIFSIFDFNGKTIYVSSCVISSKILKYIFTLKLNNRTEQNEILNEKPKELFNFLHKK